MAELRDSIKTNWTTTGQELGKDLRQFWQSSRPASPARSPVENDRHTSPKPTAVAHLSHLEVPRSPTPGGTGQSSDFAAGYSLGLIGGVRNWVCTNQNVVIDLVLGTLTKRE